MKAGEDVTGQKFGRLTAVRFDSLRGAKHRHAYWEFACDCGNHVVARLSNVKFGARVSCGRARRWPLGGPLTHVQQYRRDHRAPKHSRCERWQARFQRVVQSPSADFAWAAAALKAEAERDHTLARGENNG